MRPTVEEQLLGLRAVLQGVVAPEVRAPYPTDVLATVVGALERLAGEWATIPAALRSESGALDILLGEAGEIVGPDTAASIEALLQEARQRDQDSQATAATAEYAGDEDPYVKPRSLEDDDLAEDTTDGADTADGADAADGDDGATPATR